MKESMEKFKFLSRRPVHHSKESQLVALHRISFNIFKNGFTSAFLPQQAGACSGTLRKSHQMCSMKKLVLNISQYSQENTCVKVSF